MRSTIYAGNPVPVVLKAGEIASIITASGTAGTVSVPGEGVAYSLAASATKTYGTYTADREVIVKLTSGSASVQVGKEGGVGFVDGTGAPVSGGGGSSGPRKTGGYIVRQHCGASSTSLTAGYSSTEQKPLDVHPFYALRLALVNYGASPVDVTLAKIASVPTDLHSGSGATFLPVTVGGSTTFQVPGMYQAPGGVAANNRIPGVLFTDVIPLASVARTDFPSEPFLIQFRAHSTGVLNLSGGNITRTNGSAPYLANRGYKYGWQQSTTDVVTSISAVSLSNTSALGLIGHVEVFTGADDQFSLPAFGDSLLAGYSGAADGAQCGWPNMLDYAMRSAGAGGVANYGVGGMLHANYIETMRRVVSAMPSRPSAVYLSAFSPNSGTSTQAQWDTQYGQTLEAVHWLLSRGITPYVSNAMPLNALNATQDGYRKSFNTRLAAKVGALCDVWDFAAVIEDPADSMKINPIYNYDGIHQNLAGQEALFGLVKTELGLPS